MANNKSIQLLRAKTHSIIENSSKQLLDGQPLFDMERNTLIIGGNPNNEDSIIKDKQPINASGLIGDTYNLQFNEEKGYAEFYTTAEIYTDTENKELNIQVPQYSNNIEFTSSNVVYTSGVGFGSNASNSLLLNNAGYVDRKQYLNIGNYNIVKSETVQTEKDDGGVVIGYKNILDSRNSSIFGAYNKILNGKQNLISGYSNQIKNGQSNLISGQENQIPGGSQNTLNGFGLTSYYMFIDGKQTTQDYATYIGTYNNPNSDTVHGLPLFSVGNGTATNMGNYRKIRVEAQDYGNGYITEAMFKSILDWNASLMTDEFKLYFASDLDENGDPTSTTIYTLPTTLEDWSKNEFKYGKYVFQRCYLGRSNAFQVTFDGRAQLFRKPLEDNNGNYYYEGGLLPINDNEILTSGEIKKYLIGEQSKDEETGKPIPVIDYLNVKNNGEGRAKLERPADFSFDTLEDSDLLTKAEIDTKIEANKTSIRTLDTTPTETTEGYVGEIVQVSNGTSYQCTAVADGVYTWVKLIKATDWGTTDVPGVLSPNLNKGIGRANSSARLEINPALQSQIDGNSASSVMPITVGNLHYAVRSAITKNKYTLTDEEKKNACNWLGATKWYKHTISQPNSYDQITGNQLASMLICYSTKSTAFTNLEDDLLGVIFESSESSVYDYGDGNWLVILGVVRPNGSSKLHFYGIKCSLFTTETLTNQTIEFVPVENIFPDPYDDNPFIDTVTEL